LRRYAGIAPAPLATPLDPGAARWKRPVPELPLQLPEEGAGVGVDGEVEREGGLLQLSLVDVDRGLERLAREGVEVVADLAHPQPRAHRQEKVAVLDDEIAGPVAGDAWPPGEERVIGREQIGCADGGLCGHPQQIEHLVEEID